MLRMWPQIKRKCIFTESIAYFARSGMSLQQRSIKCCSRFTNACTFACALSNVTIYSFVSGFHEKMWMILSKFVYRMLYVRIEWDIVWTQQYVVVCFVSSFFPHQYENPRNFAHSVWLTRIPNYIKTFHLFGYFELEKMLLSAFLNCVAMYKILIQSDEQRA